MKHITSIIFFSLFIVTVMAQGKFKIEHLYTHHFPMVPSAITFGGKEYNRLNPSLFSNHSSLSGGKANRSTGLQFEIPVTPKLSMRLGAEYVSRDFSAYRSSCGNCYPGEEVPMLFKQRYIDVPLSARYYISAKQLIIFTEAGAVLSMLTMKKAQWKRSESMGKEWSMQPIEGFNINDKMVGIMGGVGIGYSFEQRVDILFTTSYRHIVTEYMPGDEYRPHAIVANIGVAYRFGTDKSRAE
jgi:hypothetical protein